MSFQPLLSLIGLGSAIETWWSWMVPMFWQVVLLAAVIWILTWSLRTRTSARFRYLLWLIVPARLILPPTLALVVGWGWWCLPPQNRTTFETVAATTKLSTRADKSAVPHPWRSTNSRSEEKGWGLPGDLSVSFGDSTDPSTTRKNDSNPKQFDIEKQETSELASSRTSSTAPSELTDRDMTSSFAIFRNWKALLYFGWLGGTLLLLTRLGWGFLQAKKLICAADSAGNFVTRLAGDCHQQVGLRRLIPVLQSSQTSTPLLVGVFCPTVILPLRIEEQLTLNELRTVLVHELQHVQRRDPLVNLVTRILAIVYWFHPAVWLAERNLRQLRELACDEATVAASGNDRKSYATGLVKVAEMIRDHDQIPALSFVERKNEMNTRVMTILDSRMHVGRGVSLAGLTAILMIALVLLPGAGRPETSRSESVMSEASVNAIPTNTNAETTNNTNALQAPLDSQTRQESEELQSNDAPTESEKTKTTRIELVVKVFDENGDPLKGVDFYVNAATEENGLPKIENSNFLSDDEGIARLLMPDPLTMVRIWPSREGYVSLFFSWEEGETESIPTDFSIILQRGTELGGIVVDNEGKPVANAKLDVNLNGGGTKIDPQERVRLNSWLANGEDRAVTDENGRWAINNAPAGDDLQLRFLVEHPDFINDKSRNPMGHYGVTLEHLRDKSARFELKKGISIRGKITDADGNPVTKGLVIWGDRPYWETGSQETNIADDGSYLIPPQPKETVRVTVVAPGWMPTDRVVDLSVDANSNQDFQLQKGNKLHLKFVDGDGKPLPEVYVGIDKWHGVEALYNNRHPNVKNTEIPYRNDDEGNYTWDWAPNDLIKLRVSIRELNTSKVIEVVATDEPQTITIKKPFALSGTVVDAKTKSPIQHFSIVPITYPSASENARGIAQKSWAKKFDNSTFTFADAFHHDDGRMVALRFQAIGYRDFTTDRFASDSPDLNTTIELQPASMRTLRTRKPDGNLATSGRVWVAQPDQGIMINSFQEYMSKYSYSTFEIDDQGEGQYGAPATRHAIVVAAAEGYAEKYLDVDEEPGELTLQPWSRLEGTLYEKGSPVSGATVIVRPIRQLGGENPHVQDIFQMKTDANGRFVFEKLPPVPVTVRGILSPWRDFPISSSRELPVDLQPDQSHEVSLGGDGIQITGKVRLLGENADQIQLRYGLNDMLRLDGGVLTPVHARAPLEYAAGEAKNWNDRLVAGLDPSLTRESHFVKLRDDGTFLVNGVYPGRYRFLLRIYEPPTGCLVEPVGYGFLEFNTNDYRIAGNELDLGTIDIQLNSIPQVGDVLPDFRYTDLDGQHHQISQLRGKRVMIDIWASWCAPCLKAFPDLAKAYQSLGDDENATMISISVDENLDQAKTTVLKHQVNWPVGFAGKSASDGSTANSLGISTVPTYIVLDPDGKIVYRGFSHEEAAAAMR